MALHPKRKNIDPDNLASRLDKVIEKSTTQTRILKKILNQLNKQNGEEDSSDVVNNVKKK